MTAAAAGPASGSGSASDSRSPLKDTELAFRSLWPPAGQKRQVLLVKSDRKGEESRHALLLDKLYHTGVSPWFSRLDKTTKDVIMIETEGNITLNVDACVIT